MAVKKEADDDALSWGTENDPTHVESPVAEEPAVDTADDSPQLSSALLITYGVFGGIFLVYVAGWIIAVQRMTVTVVNPFFDLMGRLGEVLAVASPAAWFVGVLFLTRGRRPLVRLLWLLLGVASLAPWPFILGAK